jgi:phosphinothricin acetyltransferase
LADLAIRPAHFGDAQAVCDIYAFHVAHGTATFDTAAPDVAVWANKIADVTQRGWPFLVAERSGSVLGYCYATQFRDRAAYARTCENSIYVADTARGGGWGRRCLPRSSPLRAAAASSR